MAKASIPGGATSVYNTHMRSADLIRMLERDGWQHVGGKGDHVKLKHRCRGGHVVAPHPRKDIPVGTLRNIYRQAGWKWR